MAQAKKPGNKKNAPPATAVSGNEVSVPKISVSVFEPNIWMAIICAIFGFVLYANTIGNGYVLDDNGVIIENPYVMKGFKGIYDILTIDIAHFRNMNLGYYRPLSLITFAIENQFFPKNPHVAHFDNVLLYALTGFFLCLLLMRIFNNRHPVFAFIISLLFLAHPIHTEVVANIKSRDEILSFLNLVIAIYCLIKAITPKKTDFKFLVVSCLFFYLALLSKETAMVGVVLAPLILYFISSTLAADAKSKTVNTGLSVSKILMWALPFVAVFFLFQIQKYAMINSVTGNTVNDIVNYPYAVSDTKGASMFLIFSWCVRLILLPWPLSYSYAYNQIPAADWATPGTLAGILIAGILLFFSFSRLKQKAPFTLGLLIFGITLAPAMAFVLLKGGILAERFLYAPAFGFGIIITALLIKLVELPVKSPQLSLTQIGKNVKLIIPVVLILGLYSFQTISRNTNWHDDLSLYKHDELTAHNSCQVHLHYAHEMVVAGMAEKDAAKKDEYFNKAVDELHKSLQINPHLAEAYFHLAISYQTIHINYDSAIIYYTRAVQEAPTYDLCYNNLGLIYEQMGKQHLASYFYNRAVEVNPYYADALAHHEQHRKNYGLDVKEYPQAGD